MLFSQTEIDLGWIKYGQPAQAIIPVTNNTDEYVSLNVSYSSCSCTTGSVRDTPISPNSTSVLFINLDTVKSGIGEQLRSITTNWSEKGVNFSQTFLIKANVAF